MKYFVHLRDDIVFAHHSSSTEVDIPGDNIIEVPSDGSTYLLKKYVNGDFIDAPEIKYAILDENTVVGIEKTVFSSDVKGPIITNPAVKVLWTWNGSEFSDIQKPVAYDTIMFDGKEITTSASMPAMTNEQYANILATQAQAEAERLFIQDQMENPTTEPGSEA
jgi:hypothetical protein